MSRNVKEWNQIFASLLAEILKEIVDYLEQILPKIHGSRDWWEKGVIEKLNPRQRDIVERKGIRDLRGLDLAALLRVLDQNWVNMATIKNLSFEERTLFKELHAVRNRWAHIGSILPPRDDMYS